MIWIRVVKTSHEPGEKIAGRNAVKRFELVEDGQVIGELAGVLDVTYGFPLDGIASISLTTCYFEEVVEP